jgi:hypothetical protein
VAVRPWSTESKIAGPFDEEQAAFSRGYFVGDYRAW